MTYFEIYQNIVRIQVSAFDKSMKSDFYMGMQMACDKILAMMGQVDDIKNIKRVRDVTERINHGQRADDCG